MGKTEMKRTVTSLSSMFPTEEAQKAAKRVEETLLDKQNEMNQLRGFIADNTSLINLVQKLPDELHHDIMVPFGKAAFLPGRLIHTNEFLVLLGESYYAERTAKQAAEILKRRGKSLESKVDSLKAVMQDLKAEASFFDSTASEAAEGLVEIREEYEDESSTQRESQSGRNKMVIDYFSEDEDYKSGETFSFLDPLEQDSPSFTEADNMVGASEDEEYARIMSRLEELEKEELAAESCGEDDEDQDNNPAESDGDDEEQTKAVFDRKKNKGYSSLDHDQRYSESRKPLQQSKGKDPMKEEMSNNYHHQDLINQLACTGLTVEPVTKGKMSHSGNMRQDTKMLNPSITASAPSEKKVKFAVEHSSRNEKSVQTSNSGFDGSKAFTGSIVEHTENMEKNLAGQSTTSSQLSGSQPWKPVSRFKMQRKYIQSSDRHFNSFKTCFFGPTQNPKNKSINDQLSPLSTPSNFPKSTSAKPQTLTLMPAL
ncbi:Prefoldin chaperone subunit family protein, putative isoform 1 [Theobroma cacao]|uniref:Prefoldin chaperone subunit family protein, putative isoform 1 n=1 Tax=Theobroma cacao TaxID=3641 RepID=A0A061GEM7_THECC|nr:Prefoldin chaperone subunit family protein, putative isoform 1 [Theobroma cacao]